MYQYYEFEVSLQEVEPRIWRRFLLRKEATFYELHQAIQDACGWEDYHLFDFKGEPNGKPIAGIPDPDEDKSTRDPDAKKVKLPSFFDIHKTCLYEYDFGDGWMHDVRLVETVELPYKFKRALMAGERAFPPEDSGGVGGYERFVSFLETGEDEWSEDPEDLRRWLGGWTPERFDLRIIKTLFDK